MKTLKVYGASDDLIETSGIEGCDEFGAYSDSAYKGKLLIQMGPQQAIGIHVIYDGMWVFAVVNEVDDDRLPNCPIRRTFGQDVAYSETLEVDVPDHAHLIWLKKG